MNCGTPMKAAATNRTTVAAKAQGLPAVEIGIGVNSGEMIEIEISEVEEQQIAASGRGI